MEHIISLGGEKASKKVGNKLPRVDGLKLAERKHFGKIRQFDKG